MVVNNSNKDKIIVSNNNNNEDGIYFVGGLGRRITQSTDDHRGHLYSLARARSSFSDCLFTLYSAVAVLGTYMPTETPRINVAVPAFVLVCIETTCNSCECVVCVFFSPHFLFFCAVADPEILKGGGGVGRQYISPVVIYRKFT